MSVTDSIADMLTRIRNAGQAKNRIVDIPGSKLKSEIARILKESHFIENYKTALVEGFPVIRILLKYYQNKCVIRGIKRISTPGRRSYASLDQVPRVLNGMGIAIISTSQGILTDRQAREKRIGGEILCHVW